MFLTNGMFFMTKISPIFRFILRDRFFLGTILYHYSLVYLQIHEECTHVLGDILGACDTSVNTRDKNPSYVGYVH